MTDASLTIPDLVSRRADSDGDRLAYTFLADGAAQAQSITWSQLHRRACDLAALWHERGVADQPVLLAMASGLKFVESLLACWYAGAIAVPCSLPRHARVKHRLDRVINDAGANFIVALEESRSLFDSTISGGVAAKGSRALTWLDPCESAGSSRNSPAPKQASNPLALLQYTSGSTASPRGVIVTHANLTHNSALIASACGHAPGQTIGGWLPLFHDMGLIGLLVQAAYSGATCVFMSPERFLMRPQLWLQIITDYNIRSSPAPNFAYDLCVTRVTDQHKATLDLSHWKNALSGSEPVRARTIERFTRAFQTCGFSRSAFFPCYGLAEATLLVTGPSPKSERSPQDAAGRVGCGAPSGDTQLAIVDPQERQILPDGQIGEIWVSGPSCAEGYWNDSQATQSVFRATLAAPDSQTDQRTWLRTGDLGYFQNEQLFITGRIRDLIILAGRNLFPADLEETVESAHPAIAPSGAAAFSLEIGDLERLIIAFELRRDLVKNTASNDSPAPDPAAIIGDITAALAREHGVTPYNVVLLRPGALPRTASGKLRRGTTREQYLSNMLTPFGTSTDQRAHQLPHVACAP